MTVWDLTGHLAGPLRYGFQTAAKNDRQMNSHAVCTATHPSSRALAGLTGGWRIILSRQKSFIVPQVWPKIPRGWANERVQNREIIAQGATLRCHTITFQDIGIGGSVDLQDRNDKPCEQSSGFHSAGYPNQSLIDDASVISAKGLTSDITRTDHRNVQKVQSTTTKHAQNTFFNHESVGERRERKLRWVIATIDKASWFEVEIKPDASIMLCMSIRKCTRKERRLKIDKHSQVCQPRLPNGVKSKLNRTCPGALLSLREGPEKRGQKDGIKTCMYMSWAGFEPWTIEDGRSSLIHEDYF
ncbi:hypothetical protein DFH06DRAFT_1125367 [Mycena polygramma]|nr:hypothetical protein DFH06DRAFT_1125367 [Mycena polygramma]